MKRIFLIVLALVFLTVGCVSPGNTSKEENGNTEISAEERQRIDLYIAAMKGAFEEENGGNGFVAVELERLPELGEKAKEEVLKGLTVLSPNVYDFAEVKDDKTKFQLDENGRLVRSLEGTLLWVEVDEYSENKAVITGVSWFGNLGAVFPTYEASYRDGAWQLKLLRIAVS